MPAQRAPAAQVFEYKGVKHAVKFKPYSELNTLRFGNGNTSYFTPGVLRHFAARLDLRLEADLGYQYDDVFSRWLPEGFEPGAQSGVKGLGSFGELPRASTGWWLQGQAVPGQGVVGIRAAAGAARRAAPVSASELSLPVWLRGGGAEATAAAAAAARPGAGAAQAGAAAAAAERRLDAKRAKAQDPGIRWAAEGGAHGGAAVRVAVAERALAERPASRPRPSQAITVTTVAPSGGGVSAAGGVDGGMPALALNGGGGGGGSVSGVGLAADGVPELGLEPVRTPTMESETIVGSLEAANTSAAAAGAGQLAAMAEAAQEAGADAQADGAAALAVGARPEAATDDLGGAHARAAIAAADHAQPVAARLGKGMGAAGADATPGLPAAGGELLGTGQGAENGATDVAAEQGLLGMPTGALLLRLQQGDAAEGAGAAGGGAGQGGDRPKGARHGDRLHAAASEDGQEAAGRGAAALGDSAHGGALSAGRAEGGARTEPVPQAAASDMRDGGRLDADSRPWWERDAGEGEDSNDPALGSDAAEGRGARSGEADLWADDAEPWRSGAGDGGARADVREWRGGAPASRGSAAAAAAARARGDGAADDERPYMIQLPARGARGGRRRTARQRLGGLPDSADGDARGAGRGNDAWGGAWWARDAAHAGGRGSRGGALPQHEPRRGDGGGGGDAGDDREAVAQGYDDVWRDYEDEAEEDWDATEPAAGANTQRARRSASSAAADGAKPLRSGGGAAGGGREGAPRGDGAGGLRQAGPRPLRPARRSLQLASVGGAEEGRGGGGRARLSGRVLDA